MPTDPAWVQAAEADLPGLLSGPCTLRAQGRAKRAQPARALRRRGRGAGEPLTALAREEAVHFSEVERKLRARGGRLGLPGPDDYVVQLRTAAAARARTATLPCSTGCSSPR